MMPNLTVMGFKLSSNSKTGYSVNVSRRSCRPTPLCRERCYGKRVTLADISRLEAAGEDTRCLSPNAGPITWDKMQAVYERNFDILQQLRREGQIDRLAARLASHWLRFRSGEILRGCGLGDLWPPLVDLFAQLAMHGVPLFLFSRKAEMIDRLREACDALNVGHDCRPWVLGSVDPSTTMEDLRALQTATLKMNGIATLAGVWYDETVRAGERPIPNWHIFESGIRVIFGYHTNHKHTRVPRSISYMECPATAGTGTICRECRRCYGRHA